MGKKSHCTDCHTCIWVFISPPPPEVHSFHPPLAFTPTITIATTLSIFESSYSQLIYPLLIWSQWKLSLNRKRLARAPHFFCQRMHALRSCACRPCSIGTPHLSDTSLFMNPCPPMQTMYIGLQHNNMVKKSVRLGVVSDGREGGKIWFLWWSCTFCQQLFFKRPRFMGLGNFAELTCERHRASHILHCTQCCNKTIPCTIVYTTKGCGGIHYPA